MATEAIKELTIRTAIVNSYAIGDYFLQETVEVEGERNRLIPIPIKEIIQNINFQKSKLTLTENKILIHLSLNSRDLIALLKKRKEINPIDERKLKKQLETVETINLERPLIKNWERIADVHKKLFSTITPDQFSDVLYQYYVAIDMIMKEIQKYATESLSRFKERKILFGEFHYIFSDIMAVLTTVRLACLRKSEEYRGKLDPTTDFLYFDERFNKAFFFLLEFLIALEENAISLDILKKLHLTFLKQIEALGILQPKKIEPQVIEILLAHQKEILHEPWI